MLRRAKRQEPPDAQDMSPDNSRPQLQSPIVRRDLATYLRLFGAATVVLIFFGICIYRNLPKVTLYTGVFALCKAAFLMAASNQCVNATPIMVFCTVMFDVFWLNFDLPSWILYHLFCSYMLAIVKTALTIVMWYDSADKMDEKGMAVYMVIVFVTNVIDTLINCRRHWEDYRIDYGNGMMEWYTNTESFSFHVLWFAPAVLILMLCVNALHIYGKTAMAQVTHLFITVSVCFVRNYCIFLSFTNLLSSAVYEHESVASPREHCEGHLDIYCRGSPKDSCMHILVFIAGRGQVYGTD